jgi:putative thioredoxin
MSALEVTDATFEQDVLARSETTPVIIDLWAPWCGPCRSLGPIIEKVVDEQQGRAVLAKVNVDENPRVSSTFQVQSIPAVFALYKRHVVNRFIGALPEPQVRTFVEQVVAEAQPSEIDLLVSAGDEDSLRKALAEEPAHADAIVGLARLLVERGGEEATKEALTLLARIPETTETRRLAALARMGGEAAAPGGDGLEERFDELLGRLPGDDEARQQALDLIEALAPDDPRRESYRRALSAKLF